MLLPPEISFGAHTTMAALAIAIHSFATVLIGVLCWRLRLRAGAWIVAACFVILVRRVAAYYLILEDGSAFAEIDRVWAPLLTSTLFLVAGIVLIADVRAVVTIQRKRADEC